MPADEVIE